MGVLNLSEPHSFATALKTANPKTIAPDWFKFVDYSHDELDRVIVGELRERNRRPANMLIDVETNGVVLGSRYDADLDEIARFLG